jgi:large subunit ribosomal protein L10
VKNTVAERAAAGTQAEGLLKDLKGTNSIAFTKSDPVALAKILTKVAKDVPAFQFRAGLVEGRVISIQEIGQLAQLPSKEELLSKVMFMLNAPAQRVASAMAAVTRNLAVVLSEAVKANKFGGGTAAAAPAASAASSPANETSTATPATEASAASEAPATEAAAPAPEPEPAQ